MAGSALDRRLRLARLALWAERLAPGLTAAASLVALAVALALLDWAPLLPGWLHALLLLGFAAALVGIGIRLRRLPAPSDSEAARRLEQESGLSHRPLAALGDALAQGDPELWALHRQRMEKLAATLRPGWPRPVLPRRDPHALRFAALLLLVIAGAGGLSDWRGRATRFLAPAVDLPGAGPSSLDVWVTPPPQTGLAAFPLRPGPSPTAVAIPEGSVVAAVLSGGWGRASLIGGDQSIPFTPDPGGGQRAEIRIASGSVIAVEQGWRSVARWPIALLRDAPPAIAHARPPQADERGRLQLSLEASDDYGLARAWIEVLPMEAPAGTEPVSVPLLLPGERLRNLAIAPRLDLAAHDWAGRAARLTPVAEDGAGQTGRGEAAQTTLPERIFRHPVARALIGWRRQASDAPRLGPDLAERLRPLLDDPESFGGDARVFLTLALARRVLTAPVLDRAEMRDLLWSAATRLEDGGRPAAEQNLDQARRELEQALADKAPPQRLTELLERFEAAMERYLAALAEAGIETPPSPDSQVIDQDQLAEAMAALRELAETGDRDALRRKLAELGETLARLGETGAPGGLDEAATKAMTELRAIAGRQQALLERSFRQSPPPAPEEDEADPPAKPPAIGKAESRRAAKAQAELRQDLARLGRELAPPPTALGEAAHSMAEAEAALAQGDWPGAAEHQGEALRRMRDGAREMMERMEAARGPRPGGMVERDPFGRARQGAVQGDPRDTKVPTRSDSRRAREILDELRRRAGDQRRPELEIDYLRRLLKQF